MQINLKQPGQTVTDFAVSGTTVMVAGVEIDCADRQEDVGVVIEIRNNTGGPTEGGDGPYMAQIEIPARRYEVGTAYPDDPNEEPVEVRDPVPLDPNAVVVTLWPSA